MAQNITQITATGTYSDASTQDVTNTAVWTVSDTSIATVGSNTGIVTIQNAGNIWGSTIGVTATLSPGTPGTASLIVIASDSGSVAPRMPQQDSHWQALGLSPWGTYFGLQEPSGSFCIGSGSTVFALTASVQAGAGLGPQMQSTEPGWLRNFIVMTGSAGMNMSWPAGFGPSMVNSIAFLCYGHIGRLANQGMPIVGVLRSTSTSVAAIDYDINSANSGMVSAEFNAQFKKLTGPVGQGVSDRVHPMLVVVNTSSFATLAATDIGIVTSASDAGSWLFTADGNQKGFGGYTANGRVASGSYCYFAVATGSVAESLSDPATAATFLQKLGWNVQWASCPTDSGTIKLPFLPFHWTSLGLKPWTVTWNIQETAGTNFYSNDAWPGKNWIAWNLLGAPTAYSFNLSNGFSNGWARGGFQMNFANQLRVLSTNIKNDPAFLWDQTGSFACMAYFAQSGTPLGSTSTRTIIAVGGVNATAGPTTVAACAITGGLVSVYCAGNSTTGSFAMNDSKVHPLLVVYDKTNSRVKLYTDLEKITGSFSALQIQNSVTSSVIFGGYTNPFGTQAAASGVYVYMTFTTGALAETYSDDGVASAFLKTMGWSPTW